jgi:hypothetical protein
LRGGGLRGAWFEPTGRRSLANLAPVEAELAHQGDRVKQHGLDVPEVAKPRRHAQQIDQQCGQERDVARPLGAVGIQGGQERGDTDLLEKAEQLIEERGVPQPVDLRDVPALGHFARDARLVARSRVPGQTLDQGAAGLSGQFGRRILGHNSLVPEPVLAGSQTSANGTLHEGNPIVPRIPPTVFHVPTARS